MALTPAERAKRYREKVKQNKEKYEAQKKKSLERLKKHTKKITEMTEEQQKKTRELWRRQKRRQKQNKLNTQLAQPSTSNDAPKVDKKSRNLKIKHRRVCKAYNKAIHKIQELERTIESLRKRIQRLGNSHKTEVNLLKDEKLKLLARNEVLEVTARDAYSAIKQQKVKRIIKEIAKKHGTGYKTLGLKSSIRFSSKGKRCDQKAKSEVENFYLRNDVSRITAGKKECKTMKKQKKQRRYLVDTLQNLYKIYKKQGGNYGFTTFFKYKPFYVLSPTAASRNTCLCIKHSNFEFIFNALRRYSVIQFKDIKELLIATSCDIKSYECMYNKCNKCRTPAVAVNREKLNDDITWYRWSRVDHTYERAQKQVTTKKTVKQVHRGKVADLISELQKEIPLFKTHYYNWKRQQQQYQLCVNNLQDNEVLILVDFSENFECKLGEEVQSMHFGASKQAITLHCGVIYTKDKSQSFVTISDNNCHEPHAVWAHLIPVLKLAKRINPNVSVVHFYSDGPCSQYRQKKNFYLLSLLTPKLKLSYSTWSYSEAGHGKSVADGIGGAVKRLLDQRVRYGNDITNAADALKNLEGRIKSACFLITNEEIENMSTLLPNNILAVPGTMQIHQIITAGPHKIKHRQLGCFCGEERGLCHCYNPKIQKLVPDPSPNVQDLPVDINFAQNTKMEIHENREFHVIPFATCDNDDSRPLETVTFTSQLALTNDRTNVQLETQNDPVLSQVDVSIPLFSDDCILSSEIDDLMEIKLAPPFCSIAPIVSISDTMNSSSPVIQGSEQKTDFQPNKQSKPSSPIASSKISPSPAKKVKILKSSLASNVETSMPLKNILAYPNDATIAISPQTQDQKTQLLPITQFEPPSPKINVEDILSPKKAENLKPSPAKKVKILKPSLASNVEASKPLKNALAYPNDATIAISPQTQDQKTQLLPITQFQPPSPKIDVEDIPYPKKAENVKPSPAKKVEFLKPVKVENVKHSADKKFKILKPVSKPPIKILSNVVIHVEDIPYPKKAENVKTSPAKKVEFLKPVKVENVKHSADKKFKIIKPVSKPPIKIISNVVIHSSSTISSSPFTQTSVQNTKLQDEVFQPASPSPSKILKPLPIKNVKNLSKLTATTQSSTQSSNSNTFLCYVCNMHSSLYSRTKCMICKIFVCNVCSGSYETNDYICSVCLDA